MPPSLLPGPPDGERLSAAAQHVNTSAKLNQLASTLDQILRLPGLESPAINRAVDLKARADGQRARFTEEWTPHLHEAQVAAGVLNEARNRVGSAENTLRTRQTELKTYQDQTRPGVDNSQTIANHKKKIESIESQLANAQKNLETAERRSEEAAAQANRFETTPNDVLDAVRAETDHLLTLTSALYKEATANRTLAEANATVNVNRSEFTNARDHHRRQARLIFWGMLSAAALFVLAVIYAFEIATLGSVAATHKDAPVWAQGLLLLGGRVSIIAGAGWLVVFLGRLHSRHSAQGVAYQDRIAGLDAATVILHHGTQSGREETLRKMTATYLSLEDNAFRERVPDGAPATEITRIANSISKSLARVIRETKKLN